MERMDNTLQKQENTTQSQSISIRNLVVQVGQIVDMLNTRPQGSLPRNPKEHVKAITLRSDKEYGEPIRKVTTNVEPS